MFRVAWGAKFSGAGGLGGGVFGGEGVDERLVAEWGSAAFGGVEGAAEVSAGGAGGEDFGPVVVAVDVGPVEEVEEVGGVVVSEVGAGARPGEGGGCVGEAGADGVEVDVGEGFDEVVAAERAGVEAVLPEMAAAAVEAVEALGVEAVGFAEGEGERALVLRHGDQVDVVRHQAVAEDVEGVIARLAAERLEVEEPIGVGAKNGYAVVAALGDVMRYANRHHPRLAGHDYR